MTQEIVDMILKFRDERNWKQFHNPKDMAISIALEAAELLEVFQWSAQNVDCEDKKEKMKEELADVLIYSVMMADLCGFDLEEIIKEKLERNGKKYPVEKSKNRKMKYDQL